MAGAAVHELPDGPRGGPVPAHLRLLAHHDPPPHTRPGAPRRGVQETAGRLFRCRKGRLFRFWALECRALESDTVCGVYGIGHGMWCVRYRTRYVVCTVSVFAISDTMLLGGSGFRILCYWDHMLLGGFRV